VQTAVTDKTVEKAATEVFHLNVARTDVTSAVKLHFLAVQVEAQEPAVARAEEFSYKVKIKL